MIRVKELVFGAFAALGAFAAIGGGFDFEPGVQVDGAWLNANAAKAYNR